MKGKYLVTVDNWFLAPDGQNYLAVWGEVELLSDSILGIKTNSRSSNWYARIGTDENHVIVAGCQIHYAVRCEERPSDSPCLTERIENGQSIEVEQMSRIYFTE